MNDNELEWHDGVLDDMYVNGNGDIKFSLHLYPASAAKARVRYILNCNGVTSLSSSIDFYALVQNKRAGNINNGRIETSQMGVSVLKLFLSDGYIELTASKVTIEQASRSV